MGNLGKLFKERAREAAIFIVILAVYNMLVFVIPFKRTEIFAISYVFALISIITFAVCSYITFIKAKTLKSLVFNCKYCSLLRDAL